MNAPLSTTAEHHRVFPLHFFLLLQSTRHDWHSHGADLIHHPCVLEDPKPRALNLVGQRGALCLVEVVAEERALMNRTLSSLARATPMRTAICASAMRPMRRHASARPSSAHTLSTPHSAGDGVPPSPLRRQPCPVAAALARWHLARFSTEMVPPAPFHRLPTQQEAEPNADPTMTRQRAQAQLVACGSIVTAEIPAIASVVLDVKRREGDGGRLFDAAPVAVYEMVTRLMSRGLAFLPHSTEGDDIDTTDYVSSPSLLLSEGCITPAASQRLFSALNERLLGSVRDPHAKTEVLRLMDGSSFVIVDLANTQARTASFPAERNSADRRLRTTCDDDDIARRPKPTTTVLCHERLTRLCFSNTVGHYVGEGGTRLKPPVILLTVDRGSQAADVALIAAVQRVHRTMGGVRTASPAPPTVVRIRRPRDVTPTVHDRRRAIDVVTADRSLGQQVIDTTC